MRILCGTILAAAMAVSLACSVFAALADPLAGELEVARGKGALVLSFDDRNLADWEKLIPRFRLDTVIAGEAYHTDIEDILKCVRRCAERNEAFVLTSHGIHPDAKQIHMKTEWLERILATAKECGVPCLGFDEL